MRKNTSRKMTAIASIFLLATTTCLTACSNAASAAKATDAKKEQVSPKEIPVSNDSTLKNDFFKVDNNEMTNMFGRLIKPSSVGVSDTADANVLPSDPQQAAWLDLNMTAKNPAAMEGMIRNILHEKIPENLTVKIDGVEYMSREAQELWFKYYYLLKPQIEKNEVKVKTLSEGTKAFTDGVDKNGNYIVSSQLQDLSGQKVLAFKDSRGEEVQKCNFCANIVLEEQPKDVPRGNNTVPKAPPTPKEPPTPGTPPSPGTPPPGTSAKNIAEAPQRNPKVVAADTNNVRPGATGGENATVDSSPGTSYQGDNESAVTKSAAEAQAQAEAQAAAQAAAQAQAEAEHKAAQKAADDALAAEKAAAAQAAQDAAEAAQRAANQEKAQTQTNNGVVSSDDDW